MLDNLQVAGMVLTAPSLAFFSPLPLSVSKAAFFANVESFPVLLYLFNHIQQQMPLRWQPLKVAVSLEGGFSALAGGNNNLLLRHG